MAATPPAPQAAGDDKLDRGVLLIASVVVLGAIMSILDVTVVNVAINTLAEEFDSPLSTIQWVVTGYTLALATVIPLTGWAADRFGTKRLYLTSIFLFVCGSMLSGLAWSAESLIGFRILQGFGGGMIMPLGMTILTRAAGPHRVGRVMAIIGVPMLLGPILGPILGGWLVDAASWRWIFFINLPIGIAALIASQRILARDVPQPGHRLDWLGLALLSPGLALLIYGLAETSGDGGFGRWQVIGPGLVGLAMLAAFVRHGLRTQDALIDLRLFANRVFAASSATLVLVIIAVFGGMLLLPLYLQVVRGESAMDTGLLLAPQGLGAMVAMPIAGRLTDRTGVGRIVPVGLAIVGVSFLGLTQLAADTSYWLLVRPALPDGPRHGRDDDADVLGRDADAAPRRDRPREHDAEHRAAGRRLDRHGRAVGAADPRADQPPPPAVAVAASAPRCRRPCASASRPRWPRRSARPSGTPSRSWWSRSWWRSCCSRRRSPSRSTSPTKSRPAVPPVLVAH